MSAIKRIQSRKKSFKDYTLSVSIGQGYYVYKTYSLGRGINTKEIDYNEQFEGVWNYIYFGYKKGKASGYVLFND